MKIAIKKLLITASIIFASPAFGQNVQYVSPVTRGHIPVWNTNGVIADGGSSADSPITSIGVTNNGGAGICVNSARITASGYNSLCLGSQTNGSATISLQNYGTASPQGLNFVINGTTATIPTGAGTFIFGNAPFSNTHIPCFQGTSGVVQDCGLAAVAGAITLGQWQATPVGIAFGGTGATTQSGAQVALGLGTMAVQNASSVAISGGTITGMPSPVNPTDVAIKSYVDATSQGLIILPQSQLATATVLPNTPTYANGSSGVGATLTAGSNTTLTVDGTTANLNAIVLVKNQGSTFQNGIYTVTQAGSGSVPWILTRATNFDQSSEIVKGSYTFIADGVANINSSWVLQSSIATVGTDPIIFNQFSSTGIGVTSFGGASGAILTGVGLSLSGSTVSVTGAGSTNIQTISYTIATSDCGKTVQSGTGTTGFLTLTLPSTSGFTEGCTVIVKNGDTGRGKLLVGFPTLFTNGQSVLWQTQSGTVQVVNGAWTTIVRPGRLKLPNGAFNVFADFINGNDANDCLVQTSGACKTGQHAAYLACNEFDLSGSDAAQTLYRVTFAATTADTVGVHYSCPTPPGAQGGAAFEFVGAASTATIAAVGLDAIGVFVNATVQISNLTLNSTTGACVTSDLGAQVYVLDGVTFGACASGHMVASNNSSIYLMNNYIISGNAPEHFLAQNGGIIATQATVQATLGANLGVTTFALAGQLGNISVPNWSFNLNSFTTTGTRSAAFNLGLVFTSAGTTACETTYFPGNANGSVSGGGQCN